jgi:hypothetical protein
VRTVLDARGLVTIFPVASWWENNVTEDPKRCTLHQKYMTAGCELGGRKLKASATVGCFDWWQSSSYFENDVIEANLEYHIGYHFRISQSPRRMCPASAWQAFKALWAGDAVPASLNTHRGPSPIPWSAKTTVSWGSTRCVPSSHKAGVVHLSVAFRWGSSIWRLINPHAVSCILCALILRPIAFYSGSSIAFPFPPLPVCPVLSATARRRNML